MRRKVLFCTVGAVVMLGVWGFLLLRARGVFPSIPRPGSQYCWMAFGPKARVRLLVRIDREAITLEHYDGDTPSGREERFASLEECKGITLSDPDGKTSYVLNGLRRDCSATREPAGLLVDVSIKGPVEYRQYGDIVWLSRVPQEAAVAHFHGPLTVQLQNGPLAVQLQNGMPPSGFALRRGARPRDVGVFVSTMDAARGCWVVVRTHDTVPAFPSAVHPFVDVEFPGNRPADPPIKRRYPLDQRC